MPYISETFYTFLYVELNKIKAIGTRLATVTISVATCIQLHKTLGGKITRTWLRLNYIGLHSCSPLLSLPTSHA